MFCFSIKLSLFISWIRLLLSPDPNQNESGRRMRTFESKLSVSATLYLNKIYSTEKIRKQLYFVWKIIFRVILDSAKHFNILCAAGLVLRPQAAVGQQVCERELVPALAPVPAPAGLPLQDGQPAAHGPGGRELLLPLRHEVLLHRQGAQRRHPRYSDFILLCLLSFMGG